MAVRVKQWGSCSTYYSFLTAKDYKIFWLTNKITAKTYHINGTRITQVYKVIAQKYNSSAKLQKSNLVWAIFENVALSETTV